MLAAGTYTRDVYVWEWVLIRTHVCSGYTKCARCYTVNRRQLLVNRTITNNNDVVRSQSSSHKKTSFKSDELVDLRWEYWCVLMLQTKREGGKERMGGGAGLIFTATHVVTHNNLYDWNYHFIKTYNRPLEFDNSTSSHSSRLQTINVLYALKMGRKMAETSISPWTLNRCQSKHVSSSTLVTLLRNNN